MAVSPGGGPTAGPTLSIGNLVHQVRALGKVGSPCAADREDPPSPYPFREEPSPMSYGGQAAFEDYGAPSLI
jgi:hypothetical protein